MVRTVPPACQRRPMPRIAVEKARRRIAGFRRGCRPREQVPTGEGLDLREGAGDLLVVIAGARPEERVFVAEVAVVGAPTRDHQGVRYQVFIPFEQVAAGHGRALQGSARRAIDLLGVALPQVRQEGGPGFLSRAEKRWSAWGAASRAEWWGGVRPGRRDAPRAVAVGDLVGALGGGDIGLDDHQVGESSKRSRSTCSFLDLYLDVGVR
jgi:hypothetical protein